jgi:hypothetical protein
MKDERRTELSWTDDIVGSGRCFESIELVHLVEAGAL